MGKNTGAAVEDRALIYQLEGRPRLTVALPLGLQHVLSMFIGNLAPVLVLAGIASNVTGEPIVSPAQRMLMVQCCMFASGMTTLIQLYPLKLGKQYQIGAGLPIVMGTAFAFVPTMRTLGAAYGINAILGAIMVGSVVEIIMGLFIKPLKKFFPPLVIGAVLITIGLHLLPVGVQYFAGGAGPEANAGIAVNLAAQGKEVPVSVALLALQYASWQNLLIGGTVFLVILCLQRFAKGMVKISAILIGIVVGYIVAIILGQVDFKGVLDAQLIAVPIPFSIRPEFRIEAILGMSAIYVVSGLETMGNINGITVAGFDREATIKETSGAVMADAAGSLFAAAFNTLPNTAFGQNAGIVAMTKVVNKWCIATGAFVLIVAGFCPKIGAVFSVMPSSVLGGAVITVFAMIMLNGIKLLSKAGFSDRNLLILAITFGVGLAVGDNKLLVDHLPKVLQYIFRDTTVAVCVISVAANLIFPPSDTEKALLQQAQKDAAVEDVSS
ncbi:putative Nucleobase transporter PlUacP [Hollandina sp. SP2]